MTDGEALAWEEIGEKNERERWLAAIDGMVSEEEVERDRGSSKSDYYYHVARISALRELKAHMTGEPEGEL